MWLGFGIAGGLVLWNGIHFLFPFLPELPTRNRSYQISQKVLGTRWAGSLFHYIRFAIGLGFFIPLDLSFSCWFSFGIGGV